MFFKLLLVFCLTLCQAMDQHLVCKSVNDIFSPTESPQLPRDAAVRGIQGKRGPTGARGPEGRTGARGPQGIVDYNRVNSAIDAKIRPVVSDFSVLKATCEVKIHNLSSNLTSKMESEADEFRSHLNNLTDSLIKKNSKQQAKVESEIASLNMTMEKRFSDVEETFKAKMEDLNSELTSKMRNLMLPFLVERGLCDVQYSNSCFWAIVYNVFDVNYTEAEGLCKKSGGRVADIYDQQHYDVILGYLRTKIPSSRSYFLIWIGTEYNPITRVATAQNGAEAFVRWYPGWPLSGSSYSAYTRIYIDVDRDPTDRRQGMVNEPPSSSVHGVVCGI